MRGGRCDWDIVVVVLNTAVCGRNEAHGFIKAKSTSANHMEFVIQGWTDLDDKDI